MGCILTTGILGCPKNNIIVIFLLLLHKSRGFYICTERADVFVWSCSFMSRRAVRAGGGLQLCVCVFFLGEWFIHGRCVAQRGPTGRQEPLPAAVNGRHGDKGLPKCLPQRAAGSAVDGRLTSDPHKRLQDSPQRAQINRRCHAECLNLQHGICTGPKSQVWVTFVLEVWILPGPRANTHAAVDAHKIFALSLCEGK